MSANPRFNQFRLRNVDVIQSASDPSSGGFAAAIGSFLLRDGTGQAWLKTGAGNTNWQKLVQSFGWYSVKDYGATGDNSTDDTAAVQAAINACATAGGGVVFFPPGTYRVTQLTISGQNNVQLLGSGMASSLRWTWNAGGAAGSMLLLANAQHSEIMLLKLDGAGLTNPAGSRLNHLVAVGDGISAVVETRIINCQLTGMVANSGDGVHVLGSGGNLVSRLIVADNYFDGCSRFGVGIEQGLQYGWIVENYLTNCETEIAMVTTASLANTGLEICQNQIVHTSGSVRHALRLEGDAGAVSQAVTVANNDILGGFVTMSNLQYVVDENNVQTSGAYASTDAAKRVFGLVTYLNSHENVIDRDPAASKGPCMSFERTSGAQPTYCLASNNELINEVTGGNFVTLVDSTQVLVDGNICRCTDAGATNYGFDVQAIAVAVTDVQIGPGNQITAAAGSLAAATRLLVNGSNMTNVSVVANQADNIDYGLRLEDAGAGSFNGQIMYAGGNYDGAVGDIDFSGTSVIPYIGFNAGTQGCTLRSGPNSPEGLVTARVGSLYLRTGGGQASVLYYKETGTGNTGWLGVGGQPLVMGAGDTTTVAAARFMATGYIATAIATEIKFAVTRPGTIRNLRVNVGVAGTDAQTVTFTVRKNGVDTALTTSLSNDAAGAANDLTHSFTVVAGDLLSLSIVKGGAVTAGQQQVIAAMELV